MARNWEHLITVYAQKYKIDPAAALAVAKMEGLSGGVGDAGTSFGPFQLHVGGALPKGKGRGWAESPAGIEYAIRKMAESGAAGLTGRAAINAIVRHFERPANPGKEVAGALAAYKSGSPELGELGSPAAGIHSPDGVSAVAPAYTKQDALQEGLAALAHGTYDPQAGLAALNRAARATAAAMQSTKEINVGTQIMPVAVKGTATKRERQAASMIQQYLGTDYVWGGETPAGFDCSGLLQWVWGHLGVKIPRVTYDQWNAGKKVGKAGLRPGDAVFFNMGARGPEHVGMYIGGGRFVEAPRTGVPVRISKLQGRKDFVGARRYA